MQMIFIYTLICFLQLKRIAFIDAQNQSALDLLSGR